MMSSNSWPSAKVTPKGSRSPPGQHDAMPIGDGDIVDLDPGPVQWCVEGAGALAVIAIDRQDPGQTAVGEIGRLDGPGAGHAQRAGHPPHALQLATVDVDIGRRERAAARYRPRQTAARQIIWCRR